MAKPSDFYVGVLDLFGSLLPGAVTLGTAYVFLPLPARLSIAMAPLQEGTRISAFLVVSYVVGQVASGIGSVVLDFVFDLLYDPDRGWLSRTAKPKPASTGGLSHLQSGLDKVFERGASEEKTWLLDQLRQVTKQARIRRLYQGVRAYLKVSLPEAFADIERLEGDQKFFRALTIGMLALAILLATRHDAESGPAPFALIATVLFIRYLSVRRKTIERAYLYFAVRAGASKTSPEAAHGGDEGA